MIENVTLANGVRVVTHQMVNRGTITIGVWIDVGSRSEKVNENGLSHLLEHMAFKGTTSRNAYDIAAEIEAVGGDINAATGTEMTNYHVSVLPDDLEIALEILADIFLHSTFDEEELQREKHVIEQEIGASDDTPEDQIFNAFQEKAYPDQAIGRPILGTIASVGAITRDDLFAFKKRNYRAPDIVVSGAGRLDPQVFRKLVEKHFNKVDEEVRKPDQRSHYKGGQVALFSDFEQSHVLMGYEGWSYHDDQYFTAQMLASVLGGGMASRLFQEVREKRGLCYTVQAFHSSYADGGIFGLYAATNPEETGALMDVLIAETLKIAEAIHDDELSRAKAQMKFGLLATYDSVMGRMDQIARQTLIFGKPLDREAIIDKVESVTAEQVRSLGELMLTKHKPTIGLLTRKDIQLDLDSRAEQMAISLS